MAVKPVIFQIAGFQNSGKTTLAKRLIGHLAKDELTIAAIKHHGHGGKPETAEEKDSGQHMASGAAASIVEGGGRLLLHAENEKGWDLKEQIRILEGFSPDIILIEGHKKAEYPKAVILRTEKDLPLLSSLENIQIILYWEETNANISVPSYHIKDAAGIQWIADFIKKQSS